MVDKHADRLPDKITKGDNLLIRCTWERRPWCRDDWLRVRLPNRYSYFARTENVVLVDEKTCLALAKCASDWNRSDWNLWRAAIQCKFAFDGEGSLDGVYPSDICEAHQDIMSGFAKDMEGDPSSASPPNKESRA
jgi:hypothetical protein